MQVILQPLPSGTQIYLTGNRPTEGIAGGVLQHTRLAEEIARIRAESLRFRDRQNRSNALQFSVSREHATAGVAGLYWLLHADSLPHQADVVFRVQEPSGATAGEVRLAGAMILAGQGLWEGCSTTFTYSIRGGRFA